MPLITICNCSVDAQRLEAGYSRPCGLNNNVLLTNKGKLNKYVGIKAALKLPWYSGMAAPMHSIPLMNSAR